MDSAALTQYHPDFESVKKPEGYQYNDFQIENGNFTRILNLTIDKLTEYPFSGIQLRVILAILRKTYGFNKKSDRICRSQLAKKLGVDPTVISRTINLLVECRILSRDRQRAPISYNKYFEQWDTDKLFARVTKSSHSRREKQSDKNHKSVIESDKIVTLKPISESDANVTLKQRELQNSHSESDKIVTQQKTTKQKTERKSILSDFEKSDGDFDQEKKPDVGDENQDKKSDASDAKPTTGSQWQKYHVEKIKKLKDEGKGKWELINNKQRVVVVYAVYNEQYGRRLSPFSADGKLSKDGRACERVIKRGGRLADFRCIFQHAKNQIQSGDDWKARLWGETRKELSTIIDYFDKYLGEAKDALGIDTDVGSLD